MNQQVYEILMARQQDRAAKRINATKKTPSLSVQWSLVPDSGTYNADLVTMVQDLAKRRAGKGVSWDSPAVLRDIFADAISDQHLGAFPEKYDKAGNLK